MPLVAATVTCQGGNSFAKAGRFTASLASRAQVQVIMRIVYEDPIQREDDHKRRGLSLGTAPPKKVSMIRRQA